MSLTRGTRLGPYEILEPLGAGGMGEVYRARHVKLRRDVAIKVLPTEVAGDPWRLGRFEREARTASALNHPNIVTIHDIAEQDGTTFIAMELVEGRTFQQLIAGGPVEVGRAIGWAAQVADGLARAHEAGIVHRDIKPANLMLTREGLVKILDFGLAKPLRREETADTRGSPASETQEGIVVGTPHYMAPEQCSGDAVDHRADQFAFGAMLYELLGGKPPFDGPSARAILSAILVESPPPLRRLRPEVPEALERLVSRCLAKDPAGRFASTADLAAELHALGAGRSPGPRSLTRALRRPAVAAALAAMALAAAAGAWVWTRGAERRWAERDAVDEVTRLTESGKLYEAYRTALRAERYRPADPAIRRLLERITLPIAVNTEPAGAEVFVKGYGTPDAPWERVGLTPMTLRIPYAMMRWRITRSGHEPFEGAPFSSPAIRALAVGLPLDPAGSRPAGMVRIPGGPRPELPRGQPAEETPAAPLESYFLDRYEVTNRQYREFVAAGGYGARQWWPDTIEGAGGPLRREEAMRRFVDGTGRPGPSTWEAGAYPPAEDDHPVGGISWYEAAAYCRSVGKDLPTVHHWFAALGQDQLSDILVYSNVGGEAKAAVGRFGGIGAYGTYDMAGNVKEWAWNAAGSGRYILGGAWNEPAYLFKHLIAQDPMGREPGNGVRCARYPTPPGPDLTGPIALQRSYDHAKPLTDETFALVRGMYAYDPIPLDARVERVSDTLADHRRETVSFRTAYGNERMEVHLLIPRDASPPYQSVIWFPGSDVFLLRSSERFSSSFLVDFVPRSGRVLVHPVYAGMYERFEPQQQTPSALRDMMIRWSQDLARTIDYLETRPDFDRRKIGYYGLSAGAVYGPVFTAVDPRFSASVLLAGGLIPVPFRPEVDPAAFAPRVRTPTLMINGRDDFLMPYELSQQPLFALLGPPGEAKRHARVAGGHIPSSRLEIIGEVLDWLDRHLGPVRRTATAADGRETRRIE